MTASERRTSRALVGLGEHDEAMVWLERAYQQRNFGLFFLGVDPAFDPLRTDERFKALLRRLNLKP